MRRRPILREPRLMHAAVGAAILAGPVSAALADSPHGAAAQASTLQTDVHSHRLAYGEPLVVSGHAPAADAGQPVELGYAPSGSTSWQQIASSQVDSGGNFRLSAPLQRSGEIKVTTGAPTAVAAAADPSSTPTQHVAVAAAIRVRRRFRDFLGGGTVKVRGDLVPQLPGRRVLLQAWRGNGWVTLAATRTGHSGRFGFRYRVSAPGAQSLRVRFAGDLSNAGVSRPAGRVVVLRQSVASWYQDAGTTACGFHAYYGVANLSLPCGTDVTFSYRGRTVTATVDDRGPYVGGREWDLNQNTAAALGFGGVGTVWSSS